MERKVNISAASKWHCDGLGPGGGKEHNKQMLLIH